MVVLQRRSMWCTEGQGLPVLQLYNQKIGVFLESDSIPRPKVEQKVRLGEPQRFACVLLNRHFSVSEAHHSFLKTFLRGHLLL